MKKVFAMVLCATVICFVASALAYGKINYSIFSQSTEDFSSGLSGTTVTTTGATWYISEDAGNLSDQNKAQVRVHRGYDAMSASWFYSGKNNKTPHGYNTGYTGGGYDVDIRGRLASPNTGMILFGGEFGY